MTIINGIEQPDYDILEIKQNLNSNGHCFGKSADQSGTNWATENSLTPFQCISGNNDFGSDVNDEALVVGSTDTPIMTGKTHFRIHRIFTDSVSADTAYVLRIAYGTGTLAQALTAKQCITTIVKYDSINAQVNAGTQVYLQINKLAAGTKVWAQCKNATNNATLDFFVGLHEYTV